MHLVLLRKKNKALLNLDFELPKRSDIDSSLIVGSALFGIGWGMIGFCPAPAIASLAFGNLQTLIFIVTMLIGVYLAKIIKK